MNTTTLSKILGIPLKNVLETPLGKIPGSSCITSMFSCTVPRAQYLKLVPLDAVSDNVLNPNQRNHQDRSNTSQANHVKDVNAPPQQASIDVVVRDNKVVNLDGFHRTLAWHDSNGRCFENIRLTVYVEEDSYPLLKMYETYDSRKAVKNSNHRLSSAYRIAEVLPRLTSVKMRAGGYWSAIRRVFGFKGTQVSLEALAAAAEANEHTLVFLDKLQCAAQDQLQNVEMVAFAKAFRSAAQDPVLAGQVVAFSLQVAAFVRTANLMSSVPAPIKSVYESASCPLPHSYTPRKLEQPTGKPLGSRSGEAVLDCLAGSLTEAVLAHCTAVANDLTAGIF